MAGGGWEEHDRGCWGSWNWQLPGAKKRIWTGERTPGRAKEAAAVGVQGALAVADSQRSKCLGLRVRRGGNGQGGGWGRGNRGTAAGVEARPLLRSEAYGLWLGSNLTHPPTLSSLRPQTDFSPRSTVGRAGAGAARVVGGAELGTNRGGDPSSGIGKDVGHPFPLQKTHPKISGRGVWGVPSLLEGKTSA